MKLEQVVLKVEGQGQWGGIYKITAESGEVAFLTVGSVWRGIFPTLRPILEQMLQSAKNRYESYKRACPGRDGVARDIAFYKAALEQLKKEE